MTNFKVNTLLIGTQKAGTTSLFEYLKQHPDVCFSKIKEVTFFADDRYYKKGMDYYHSFFNSDTQAAVIASAYVHMLPCRKCPARVQAYNPNMKFIVLLREPWSRAHSAFRYAVKNGWEREAKTLNDAVRLESDRIMHEQYDLTYLYNSKYYEHLSHWTTYFDRNQFFITRDEDLKENPEEVMRRLALFLEIDTSFKFNTSKQFNPSGGVRFKWLQHFLLSRKNGLKTALGTLLPHSLRATIRARLFRRLILWNETSNGRANYEKTALSGMEHYFKEDQDSLKKWLEK